MFVDWAILELLVEVGGRSWDAIKNRQSPYNTERFIQAHDENLRQTIDNLLDISDHSQPVLVDNVRSILRAISSVVKANIRDQNVIVNANYMVPRPAAPELMKEAAFCDSKRRHDSYKCFLELRSWAYDTPDLPSRLVLPVDKTAGEMLFGAPTAYATHRTVIVRNTRKVYKTIDKRKHPEIRHAVEDYFNAHRDRIRSFATLPIRVPTFFNAQQLRQFNCAANDVIGVMNVQSSKTSVLGVFEGNQRKLEMAIGPYVHILAHHVLRLHNPIYAPKASQYTAK